MCDVSHDLLKGEHICFSAQTYKRAPMMNGRGINTEAVGSPGPDGNLNALSFKEGGKKGPEPRYL